MNLSETLIKIVTKSWKYVHVLLNVSRLQKLQMCKRTGAHGDMFSVSSVQSLSCVQLFATPCTAACQASLSITNSQSLLKLIHWVGDAIQTFHPLSSPSPPALNLFQHQGFFQWVGSSNRWPNIQVSASPSVLPMNVQDWFRLGWTDWLSLESKGLSQESSPTPQFRSINSSVLSFLYSPTLTSIQDDWSNHSFD